MPTKLEDALWWYEQIRINPFVMRWLNQFAEHDPSLLSHSHLVGAVASAFARIIDLPEADHESFIIGALLHDAGKLMLTPSLLHKLGPLSAQERKEMEGHAAGGFAMLQPENFHSDVLDIVHLHHERMDGSGYPNGLKGDQLTLQVRMIAICDVFSALIEDRAYRPRPARPLDILLSMTDILDAALVQRFTVDVASLAYEAKEYLDAEFGKRRFAHVS